MPAEVRDHIIDRLLFFLGILFRSDCLEQSFEQGPAKNADGSPIVGNSRLTCETIEEFGRRSFLLANLD